MENFTPFSALAGGVLIGLSATLLLLFNGRIAGVSGILSGIFVQPRGDRLWRLMFVLGMVGSGAVYQWFSDAGFEEYRAVSMPLLLVGAFFVGFGTRMGGGCTSGHGVCGIGRVSPRSIIATFVFMGFGFITVFVLRHLLGVGV
ncbi:hypothetical protein Tel_02285 [Candidatus Tenderia electrophaga]|uniref:Uncharacterized protein n=1 Tax=Candidatus Tenderia electrophaga TaxID=1748243 RepID=A0A0S2TA69_9GAMM|nr:hypothetical protein Tel_02285 [Candidatus Tenderia electrophaga]